MRLRGVCVISKRSHFALFRDSICSCASKSLVLKVTRNYRGAESPSIAFILTKKVGSAVIRNRIRRRLRSALLRVLPTFPLSVDFSHMIIGRNYAFDSDFLSICRDLRYCIKRCYSGIC